MTPKTNRLTINLAAETTSLAKNRLARRLLIVNLGGYVFLSGSEWLIGTWTQSAALLADGKNNLTGVFSATLLLVGLRYAQKPRDAFHLEGHWQYEELAVFLSGLLMVLVGLSCIWSGGLQTWRVLRVGKESLNLVASLTAGLAGGLLALEVLVNFRQGRLKHDSVLLASAQDYCSDAVSSLVTMLAVTVAWLTHWYLLDTLTAIALGGYIVINGSQILSQSAAKLSNGFDPKKQRQISQLVCQQSGIKRVVYVNGRYVGDNLVLDIAVIVAPQLSTQAADQIRHKIRQQLVQRWPLLYCCVEFRADPSGSE